MRLLIIPDSFKGSMPSLEVAEIIEKEAIRYGLQTQVIPIADGGEGTVDCVLRALGGHKEYKKVFSPEGKEIEAYYGITRENTAVIEIAESSGITKQSTYRALEATTYGFGQLIEDALNKGCRNFLLALGGSATTDCGCGMAAALGVCFRNEAGETFVPVGGSLSQVAAVDVNTIDARIREARFTVMCDVENPLYGLQGAAYIFGPQKGASAEEVALLDEGLRHVSCKIEAVTGKTLVMEKGSGAAGGTGYACQMFFDAKLQSGIEAILEISDFDRHKKDSDLIITGEGKIDEQSMMGKVLSGIKTHADKLPIVAFCGICTADKSVLEQNDIRVIEIGRDISLQEAMSNGRIYLQEKAKAFFEKMEERKWEF